MLRYPGELTGAQCALVAPGIAPARRGGNKRTDDVREVVNGIMYGLRVHPRSLAVVA